MELRPHVKKAAASDLRRARFRRPRSFAPIAGILRIVARPTRPCEIPWATRPILRRVTASWPPCASCRAGIPASIRRRRRRRDSVRCTRPRRATGWLTDPQGRQLRYLRLSITDRCDLRCTYCMPDVGARRRREDVLSPRRGGPRRPRVSSSGVRTVRLTGGEPLVRRESQTWCA